MLNSPSFILYNEMSMQRKLLLSLFVLFSSFFIFPQAIHAQDLTIKDCLDYNNPTNNVGSCTKWTKDSLTTCINNGIDGKTIQVSTWGPGATWGNGSDESCVDTNNDGELSDSELQTCALNFARYTCRNLPRTGLWTGSCSDSCDFVEDGSKVVPDIDIDGSSIDFTVYFKNIFTQKYKNDYLPSVGIIVTPTPTPTLIPTTIPGVEPVNNCLSALADAKSCEGATSTLSKCLLLDDTEKINYADPLWQATTNDSNSLVNLINQYLNSNTNTLNCIDSPEYDALINDLRVAQGLVAGNIQTDPDNLIATPVPVASDSDTLGFFEGSYFNAKIFGQGCGLGDSTDPELRKCCTYVAGEVKINTGIPVLSGVTDIIAGAANIILSGIEGIAKTTQKAGNNIAKLINPDNENSDQYCAVGHASSDPFTDQNCTCLMPDETKITVTDLCRRLKGTPEFNDCMDCLGGETPYMDPITGKQYINATTGEPATLQETAGIWTAMGCINVNMKTFIEENIFGPILGIAGIISLGCIIYASFLMQVSQGNPEQIQKAQEMITSCITGLILIIFSVFVLRVIGVDILRIPGFN